MIGHNNPPSSSAMQAIDEANRTTSVVLLCKEFLIRAIEDRTLERSHLRVLACIVRVVNTNAQAWPSRSFIAFETGLTVKTVSNLISELRQKGYLIASRETVPEANNRNITVYRLGNIDHDTIRQGLDRVVAALVSDLAGRPTSPQAGNWMPPTSPPAGNLAIATSPPAGNLEGRSSPPTGKFPAEGELVTSPPSGKFPAHGEVGMSEFPAHGEVSSPPTGKSEPSSPPAGTRIRDSTIKKEEEDRDLSSGEETEENPLQAPSAKKTRGSRLPEAWMLPKSWGEWTLEKFVVTPDEVRREAERFKNHWLAKAGPNAVKVDWQRTWQNWCGSEIRGWRRRGPVAADIAPSLAEQDEDTELKAALSRMRADFLRGEGG